MSGGESVWKNWHVVALAGGVGGAKLAHGLAQVLPAGQLSVIVNVGDDFEHYGLHISPDLDTVMYTLSGLANSVTGWGLVDESWQMLKMLQAYGETTWFGLGDRDLGTHLLRTEALHHGQRLTEITQRLASALGIQQTLLPATDSRLRTIVESREYGALAFQEYFVKHKWQPTVTRLHFEGAEKAVISPEVEAALDKADLIVICPSNPLLSIDPILAVAGIRERLEQRRVPVVAVSPLISGKAVKGPADKLMAELGLDASALGIAAYYQGIADTLVIDHQDQQDAQAIKTQFPDISVFQAPILMQSIEDRNSLARYLLNYLSEVS